jgi:hypothetical protein
MVCSVYRLSLVCVLLLGLTTGCSNVIRSGLMNSNTVFLDPSTNRTVHLQLRNISENQDVTLATLPAKLSAKGYQVVMDPQQANYWIQAKVVYCHQAADGITPEVVAQPGFGAGVGPGGSRIASAAATETDGRMPDINAMMRMAMAGGVPGMQAPPKEEGVTYLCVVDARITDYRKGKPLGQLTQAKVPSNAPNVQQMRMVGHVRQKDLDIPEATPIIQDKLTTGIAGLF